MIPSLQPVLDKILAEFPDALPQWGPHSLTIICRREMTGEMAFKLAWAYQCTLKAVTMGRCVYTSFNANLRVASWSALFWEDDGDL